MGRDQHCGAARRESTIRWVEESCLRHCDAIKWACSHVESARHTWRGKLWRGYNTPWSLASLIALSFDSSVQPLQIFLPRPPSKTFRDNGPTIINASNTNARKMSRSRAPLFLGLTAAGGVGYYLYGAGGSPKVAEKNFEGERPLVSRPGLASSGASWPWSSIMDLANTCMVPNSRRPQGLCQSKE